MRDLALIVERLRMARTARARFLRLWKVTRARRFGPRPASPAALDRLLADVARAGAAGAANAPAAARCALAGRRIDWLRPGGRLGDIG